MYQPLSLMRWANMIGEMNARVDAALARQLDVQLGAYVLPVVAPVGIKLEDLHQPLLLEQAVRSALMERAAVAVKACRASLSTAENSMRSLQPY